MMRYPQLSIAPMMDCTDRHFRYLARLINQDVLLYTEMVTTGAAIHGDQEKLLGYNPEEHPIAIQLGGSDPTDLAQAAQIAERLGYDEVNLNVGCPSDRVQAGRFGACLMKEPELVANCINAMKGAVRLPVTVKTRLGVDNQDSYQALKSFVNLVAQAGCKIFIIHARKAWLNGLSPRENRSIPPLQYDFVYRLKQDFPDLTIGINGGIRTQTDINHHLQYVDSVMIGREAYSNPWILASPEKCIKQVLNEYMSYVSRELQKGVRLRALTRHLVGLFHGSPGARAWRRCLTENAGDESQGIQLIERAMNLVVPKAV